MVSQSLRMDHFEACLAGMGLPARFQDNQIDIAQSDGVISITVSRMSLADHRREPAIRLLAHFFAVNTTSVAIISYGPDTTFHQNSCLEAPAFKHGDERRAAHCAELRQQSKIS